MTTQLAPHRMNLPPPSQCDLHDIERVVGWIDGSRVGFLGFADEREVASAAWLAYRTISRRLAGRSSVERPHVPGWEELGVLSAAILVIAVLVPAKLGPGLLALGLAGLFVVRIAMMYR